MRKRVSVDPFIPDRLTEEQKSSIDFFRARTNRVLKKNEEYRRNYYATSGIVILAFFAFSLTFHAVAGGLTIDWFLSRIGISLLLFFILIALSEIGYRHACTQELKRYTFHVKELVRNTPASLDCDGEEHDEFID